MGQPGCRTVNLTKPLNRAALAERVGKLGPKRLAQILGGIDVVLGR
jgi:nucleotidyltransferase/DNA polymerase involved in DNA repair